MAVPSSPWVPNLKLFAFWTKSARFCLEAPRLVQMLLNASLAFFFFFCRGKQLTMADLGVTLQNASSNWIHNKGKEKNNTVTTSLPPGGLISSDASQSTICSVLVLRYQTLRNWKQRCLTWNRICRVEPFKWTEMTWLTVWELYDKVPLSCLMYDFQS